MRNCLAPLATVALLSLTGCLSAGPSVLKADEVDYGRALGEAKKREIVALLVGLRYADAPAFLTVTQVIAAYTFTATATGAINSRPDPGGPAAGVSGTAAYSDHPTFTFTPTTGESYARAYIQPLSPALVLPLADSGIPIDLLLRIAVQSIGGLRNAAMLGGTTGNGSPEFFELLAILRRLQLAGDVSMQYKPGANGGHVSLTLGSAAQPSRESAADIERVRQLLHLAPGNEPYPLVFGNAVSATRDLPVVTRSVLGILSSLGAEIRVPGEDVDRGATQPAIQLVGNETRPVILIHAARKVSGSAYAVVNYHQERFWIDDNDFDSKYALTVVQELMALAEITDTSHAPVVTVPAN